MGPLVECPACHGTGTEYGPGNVIPGWCSLCFGDGEVDPEEAGEWLEDDDLEDDE